VVVVRREREREREREEYNSSNFYAFVNCREREIRKESFSTS
jgi:hypothetical protein